MSVFLSSCFMSDKKEDLLKNKIETVEKQNNSLKNQLKKTKDSVRQVNVFFSGEYEKLYKKYVKTFVKGLKTSYVEELLSSETITYVFRELCLYKAIQSYNYSSLLRDDLDYFENRKNICENKDGLNRFYYSLDGVIKENLKIYFSNPNNLKSFYKSKKLIFSDVFKSIPFGERKNTIHTFDRVIESFELILTSKFKITFENYLQAENEFLKSAKIDNKTNYSMQNAYDKRDSMYYEVLDGFSILDTKASEISKNKFYTLRKELFSISPFPKATAFAYRRYTEGGDDLIKAYIFILNNMKALLKETHKVNY